MSLGTFEKSIDHHQPSVAKSYWQEDLGTSTGPELSPTSITEEHGTARAWA